MSPRYNLPLYIPPDTDGQNVMKTNAQHPYASRAGLKLAHALRAFDLTPRGWTCADLGSSTGGFVDCLLQSGAAKVYAVERGYGVLAFKLRGDRRVVVMERTDALHVHLPEGVRLVTIDAGWTRQARILPVALKLLGEEGEIISLIKPHYEADPGLLQGGVLPDQHQEALLTAVRASLVPIGLNVTAEVESPIRGSGGNREYLWRLRPAG